MTKTGGVVLLCLAMFFIGAIVVFSFEIEKPIIYEVKEGDSIWRIAYRFQLRQYQLLKANNFEEKVILHPGDRLIIPKPIWRAYEGCASWYGPGFHGKKMANGEVYDQNDILAAHRHYPFEKELKVINLENGRSVILPVKDRGPYTKDADCPREIDLSYAAAKKLGMISKGVVRVRIEPLT